MTTQSASLSAPVRWALALWLAVAAAVAVRTLVAPDAHTVFPILAAGSSHWWSDEPLYADYKPLDYFRYPPVLAVAFTPFELLGDRAGAVLWSGVSIVVYVVGLRRFVRDVAPGDWSAAREAVFLALGALGALRGLWNAQSNALAVGMILLAASALLRKRGWTAAALLGVSVLVKVSPLAPALLLCTLQPRRLAGRFAVVLAVGLLIPFLTRPPAVVWEHYREWLAHLTQTGDERWPGFRDAWTVWLVLRQAATGAPGVPALKEPLHSVAYRAVQLLTAGGALVWCLWQRRRVDDPRRLTMLTLGMGLGWLMLFGPAVEHPTFVFLAPVLGWALLQGDWPRGRWLIVPAGVLVLLLGWDAVARPFPDAAPLLLTALPCGTALFLAWLVGYAAAVRACPAASGGGSRLPRSAPLSR